jgi:hypothetical protein
MRLAIKVEQTLGDLIVDPVSQLFMNNLAANQLSLSEEAQLLNLGI